MDRTDKMKQEMLGRIKETAKELSKEELIECLSCMFLFSIDPSDIDAFKGQMDGKPWSGIIVTTAMGFMLCGLDRREDRVEKKEQELEDPCGIERGLKGFPHR